MLSSNVIKRIVLGCIEAELHESVLIGKLLTRCTGSILFSKPGDQKVRSKTVQQFCKRYDGLLKNAFSTQKRIFDAKTHSSLKTNLLEHALFVNGNGQKRSCASQTANVVAAVKIIACQRWPTRLRPRAVSRTQCCQSSLFFLIAWKHPRALPLFATRDAEKTNVWT